MVVQMTDNERLDDPDLIVASLEDARARRDGRNKQVDYSAVTDGYLDTVSSRDGSWLPESGEGPTAREMLALHEAGRESSVNGFPGDEFQDDQSRQSVETAESPPDADETLGAFSSEQDDRARSRTEGLRGSAELAPQRRHPRSRGTTRAARGTATPALSRGSETVARPTRLSTEKPTKFLARRRRGLISLMAVGVTALCLVGLHFGLTSTPSGAAVGGTSSVDPTHSGLPWIKNVTANELVWRPAAIRMATASSTKRLVHRHKGHPGRTRRAVNAAGKKQTPTTATHSTPPSTAASTQNSESRTSSDTKPVEPSAITPTQSQTQSQTKPASGCGGAGVLAPTNCGRPSL
jgi:hypothetical protein